MKILVLEDDPVSLKALSSDLIKFGHEVLASKNSVEAFGLLSKNMDLDLVITDLHLPYDSGVDFIKDVRSINAKIPIVVISGTIDKSKLLQMKKYKCLDYLVKPHDKNRLESILNSVAEN